MANHKELETEAIRISKNVVEQLEVCDSSSSGLSDAFSNLESALADFTYRAEEMSTSRDSLVEYFEEYKTFAEENANGVSADTSDFIDGIPSEDWWGNDEESFADDFSNVDWGDASKLDWAIKVTKLPLSAKAIAAAGRKTQ